MKKSVLILLLIVTGAAILSGCGYAKSPNSSTAVDKEQTQEVQNKNGVYFMAGQIEADEKIDLKAKITAKVTHLSVQVGDHVKKGEPVVSLDSQDLQAQAAQAQAGLAQVQASLSGAKANYENAKTNYDRNSQLFQAGAISQSQLEQFQTALAAAETAQNIAHAQLKQAQAAYELAETQQNNAVIPSPIDGVVSAVNIHDGELAVAGIPLLTVVNPDALTVNAYLPAGLLNKIKVGQKVGINVAEISGQELRGEISVIDPVVNPAANNVLVKIKFEDPSSRLMPGMFAEIDLFN